jgi:MYXO-CTERM domain-containing protein
MGFPIATAGGFGGKEHFTDEPSHLVLAPDAPPKLLSLFLIGVLGVGLWRHYRRRSL